MEYKIEHDLLDVGGSLRRHRRRFSENLHRNRTFAGVALRGGAARGPGHRDDLPDPAPAPGGAGQTRRAAARRRAAGRRDRRRHLAFYRGKRVLLTGHTGFKGI